MTPKPLLLAVLVASLTTDATQAAAPAALVFPIPAGACPKIPCAINPYPAGSPDVSPSLIFPIPPGSDARGMIQTQELQPGMSGATVLYSVYNADKSFLQTLWIQVMPSRGGYHTMLTTCRADSYPVTPCKV